MDMIGQRCRYYCCRHRFESVRQTSSYYCHTTPQPYCRPEASSSKGQHHAREAAYPRRIEAYNPSSRIGRAGGADACTPTTPHDHDESGSVVVLAAAAYDSVVATRSPFAYLMYPPPRTFSAVRAGLPEWQLYLVSYTWYMTRCYRSHFKHKLLC